MSKDDDLPLVDYARKDPAGRAADPPSIPRVFRQVIFGLGVWLLAYGIGCMVVRSMRPGNYDDASFIAWGAALIALVIPLPRWNRG